MTGGDNLLVHYFSDQNINKAEYDSSTMSMFITFASGNKLSFLYVPIEMFESLIETKDPYGYIFDEIMTDPSIGRS